MILIKTTFSLYGNIPQVQNCLAKTKRLGQNIIFSIWDYIVLIKNTIEIQKKNLIKNGAHFKTFLFISRMFFNF